MTPDILVPVADGTEDTEAVATLDVLHRAGLAPAFVGLRPGPVAAAHGTRILPHFVWDEAPFGAARAIVLPGGRGGTDAFLAFAPLHDVLRAHAAAGKLLAAICAAPEVLGAAGLLRGKTYTCYPGCQNAIPDGTWRDAPVVVDGLLVTGQGPGVAIPFALAVAAALAGPAAADRVAAGMLVPR